MGGRRHVHNLGEAERNAIWECRGPAWRAFYAWSGDDSGRWYYVPSGRTFWHVTAASALDVNARSITSGTYDGDPLSFEFVEVIRLGEPAILFTDNGQILTLPSYLTGATRHSADGTR